jgi:hypothetical protein
VHEGVPPILAVRLDQETFEAAATRMAPTQQSRREDPRVVDDEDVARAQPASEIRYDACRRLAGSSVEDEQAGRAALGGRMLGDAVGRQVVIEIVGAHFVRDLGAPGGVLSLAPMMARDRPRRPVRRMNPNRAPPAS